MASKRDRLVGQFVNKSKGSERQGQRFKVVTKGGVRYHDYGGGRLIADKAGPSKPVGTATPGSAGIPPASPAPKVPTNIGPPSATHKTPPPTPAGFTSDPAKLRALMKKAGVGPGLNPTGGPGRLNVAEASPRYGQRFDVVHKAGKRYHRYGKGRMFADAKRGPGSISTKPVY